MITIIDYGLGNLTSVANALKKLSIACQISDSAELIQQSSGLILPGVGAANEAMKNLKARKLDQLITNQVAVGKPLLGICLGMQLLFTRSDEGNTTCLNVIKGKVEKLKTKLKVPQIGWNQVNTSSKSRLLKEIRNKSYFYFVHSYYCDPKDKQVAISETEYEIKFCSAVERNNVYGVQFHPEKSSEAGLKILKNFRNLL